MTATITNVSVTRIGKSQRGAAVRGSCRLWIGNAGRQASHAANGTAMPIGHVRLLLCSATKLAEQRTGGERRRPRVSCLGELVDAAASHEEVAAGLWLIVELFDEQFLGPIRLVVFDHVADAAAEQREPKGG